jgi:hypothetical protein
MSTEERFRAVIAAADALIATIRRTPIYHGLAVDVAMDEYDEVRARLDNDDA